MSRRSRPKPERRAIQLTKSQPVALLGEAPPLALVEPQGVRGNSWQDVADLSARAGVVLDPWQELILRAAMGERADATWAAKRVGVSVPRQNGKSQLLVSRALAGALLFDERKIVISAHQQDTARESFGKLQEIIDADGNGWIRSRIRPNGIISALNREAVRFTNGATIQFKARTQAGGRGFSSDCLMLDEAQRLGRRAWVSINSTMSAMPNPQVWLLGTPPTPEDDGAVFASVRKSARDCVSTAAAWVEYGADPKSADYDPASEFTRWQANPAWNTRINHEVVQGEFESYSPEEFAQERLGVWLSDVAARRHISAADWDDRAVDRVSADGVRAYGVAFSVDGSRVALAAAIRHDDGVHVEPIAALSGSTEAGVAQMAAWLAERWRTVAEIHIAGPDGKVMHDELRKLGVPDRVARVVTTGDYFAACAAFVDGVRDKTLTHPKAPDTDVLNASVAVCDRKVRASGMWGWEATTEDGDETPIEAASLAYRAAKTTKRRPGRTVRGRVL